MQKKHIVSRLSRITGQINGISKLVEKKSSSNAVIQQIEAVKGALTSIEKMILEENLTKKGLDKELRNNLRYILKNT